MKTPNDIRKIEEKLLSFLMVNDVRVGEPVSKEKYAPLSGYEYDAMAHTISLVIPHRLIRVFSGWFIKQGLDNISHHEIEKSSYVKMTVYL